jgi:hypothetical protein
MRKQQNSRKIYILQGICPDTHTRFGTFQLVFVEGNHRTQLQHNNSEGKTKNPFHRVSVTSSGFISSSKRLISGASTGLGRRR